MIKSERVSSKGFKGANKTASLEGLYCVIYFSWGEIRQLL